MPNRLHVTQISCDLEAAQIAGLPAGTTKADQHLSLRRRVNGEGHAAGDADESPPRHPGTRRMAVDFPRSLSWSQMDGMAIWRAVEDARVDSMYARWS